jgi:SOS-response transcriptional repressor LexA
MAQSDNTRSLIQIPTDALSSNILLLMKKKGINAAELSRETNVPRPTINKILHGKTEDPRASTLRAIADYFNLTIDELFSTTLDREKTHKFSSQAVPIISWEDCIDHALKVKDITANNWHDWIACNEITPGAYALKSRPSMEELLPKGTVLIIDPSLTAHDGDYIVIHYAGTKEATLRQLTIDGAKTLLIPINQTGEVEPFSKKIKILGVLVKSIFSYC